MLKVTRETFEELSDSEKENVSNNGSGKEYAHYLRVIHNNKQLALFSDAMEPEDTQFTRDLSWIQDIIEGAYNAGKEDALAARYIAMGVEEKFIVYKDKILEEAKKGNVCFWTLEGVSVAKLDEFIKQPAQGILYDLNRGPEVVLTFIEDKKWVNDYAVCQVISRLKTLLDEALAKNNTEA